MKIAIDVDNVVANLFRGFCDFYNSKYHSNIKEEDFTDYYLKSVLKIDKKAELKLFEDYFNSTLSDNIPLIENSKEIIDLLKENHELFFITARDINLKEKTLRYFQEHFPKNNFKILFSGDVYGGKNKEKICSEQDIHLIIEDHPIHSLTYAKNGIIVLLFDKIWNKGVAHENIIRIYGWRDIPEIINKIEVKNGAVFSKFN